MSHRQIQRRVLFCFALLPYTRVSPQEISFLDLGFCVTTILEVKVFSIWRKALPNLPHCEMLTFIRKEMCVCYFCAQSWPTNIQSQIVKYMQWLLTSNARTEQPHKGLRFDPNASH